MASAAKIGPHSKLMVERKSPRGLVPARSVGRFDEPYNAYLNELDPRGESSKSESVRFALATATDVRFREFLACLSKPQYARYHLATIAKTCDIGLPEFNNWWQKAQTQRAIAIAQDGLADLTSDLVNDARTRFVTCERCDGFGYVFIDADAPIQKGIARPIDAADPSSRQIRTCPDCKGRGAVPKSGDVDARRMVLEMTGVTGKRGGAAVQITQNFGSMESAVERMNAVSFDVSGSDAIDVEAVEAAASETES